MLNFFARSGRKIEKIDSLRIGRGIEEREQGQGKVCGCSFNRPNIK